MKPNNNFFEKLLFGVRYSKKLFKINYYIVLLLLQANIYGNTAKNVCLFVAHSCYVGNGNSYRGVVDVTESGNECDKWVNARRTYPQYKSSKYLELTGNLLFNFCIFLLSRFYVFFLIRK